MFLSDWFYTDLLEVNEGPRENKKSTGINTINIYINFNFIYININN